MYKQLLALLCSFFIFSSTAMAEEKTYINGIDANYPPFAYVNESGKPDGFDVHALNWIANKQGFKVVHVPMDWDGIIPAMLAEKIDIIASGMTITPVRAERVNFTEPYWTAEKYFVVKKGSPITEEDILTKPIKLGVQRGTSEHDYLEKMKGEQNLKYELRFYDSAPLAINDLQNGRIDAIGLDAPPANDAIAKGFPVEIVGTFLESGQFGVAVRKQDTELLKKLNEGYVLLMQDPYWNELQEKYINAAN